MRIFLAGATGVMGRRLVPALVGAGHDVMGTSRSADRAERLKAAGAVPVVLDPLDGHAVRQAVTDAKPDLVMHQLTALAGFGSNFRRFDEEFAETNRLRTEALDHLLSAAVAAGARRFVAQSYAGWPLARTGGRVKTEDDPLDPDPPIEAQRSHAAIRHLESAVTRAPDIEGVVLRYGMFYGPETALARGSGMLDMVRGRKMPIVGGGTGVWSFVHIDDAAAGTAAAVEHAQPGIYHLADDEPAPVSQWLPYLAEVMGAKPPRKVPAWLVRPMLGAFGVSMMTDIRGASNARARRDLGWTLRYPSWRGGFRTGLG